MTAPNNYFNAVSDSDIAILELVVLTAETVRKGRGGTEREELTKRHGYRTFGYHA